MLPLSNLGTHNQGSKPHQDNTKPMNSLKIYWWGIFPRERRVPLWQSHDTVWGGIFTNTLGTDGQKHRLNPSINEDEGQQKLTSI